MDSLNFLSYQHNTGQASLSIFVPVNFLGLFFNYFFFKAWGIFKAGIYFKSRIVLWNILFSAGSCLALNTSSYRASIKSCFFKVGIQWFGARQHFLSEQLCHAELQLQSTECLCKSLPTCVHTRAHTLPRSESWKAKDKTKRGKEASLHSSALVQRKNNRRSHKGAMIIPRSFPEMQDK